MAGFFGSMLSRLSCRYNKLYINSRAPIAIMTACHGNCAVRRRPRLGSPRGEPWYTLVRDTRKTRTRQQCHRLRGGGAKPPSNPQTIFDSNTFAITPIPSDPISSHQRPPPVIPHTDSTRIPHGSPIPPKTHIISTRIPRPRKRKDPPFLRNLF